MLKLITLVAACLAVVLLQAEASGDYSIVANPDGYGSKSSQRLQLLNLFFVLASKQSGAMFGLTFSVKISTYMYMYFTQHVRF